MADNTAAAQSQAIKLHSAACALSTDMAELLETLQAHMVVHQ